MFLVVPARTTQGHEKPDALGEGGGAEGTTDLVRIQPALSVLCAGLSAAVCPDEHTVHFSS